MIYALLDEVGNPGAADCLITELAAEAYTIALAVSLGQVRTLVEKPDTMKHTVVPNETLGAANISLSGIRLSIGLEDPEDIIEDLRCAFDRTFHS